MFKSIAISASILLVGDTSAFAGGYMTPGDEVPLIVAPQEPQPTAENWEGLYLGGALGYAFGADDRVGITPPSGGRAHSPGSVDIQGVTYSLHAGYRWQRELRGRQFVTGPELAYEGGGADDGFFRPGESASSELDSLLSLRWKAGILNMAEDTLFYGTVGISRGEFNYSVVAAGMNYKGDFKDNAWTVSLGIEKRLNARVSLFGEWEFRQFGKTALSDAAGYETQATPKHHHIRIGANFSF
ncbi:outer membrane protein [Paracoccus versutus]|uniref:outer membrane protein n=1 Tax=Paracoccus versutus TaxID=34007 RepID=UPI000DF81813|nr:outer membrane beta-barrel protein [Paracoccus versutus]RDD71234.1 hypothetical protein DVR11_11935 [Paracoccus versutus]